MIALRRSTPRLLIVGALAVGVAGCGGTSDSGGTQTAEAPVSSQPAGSHPATAEPNASPSPAKVDAAFVREMTPHHGLAVEMAQVAVDRSHRTEITTLAKNIIRTQTAEITELQAAGKRLGVTVSTSMAMGGSPQMTADSEALGLSPESMGMSMSASTLKSASPFDRAFLEEMLPHHRGAIAMAKSEVAHGGDAALKKLASAIVTGQSAEYLQMTAWLKRWYPAAS